MPRRSGADEVELMIRIRNARIEDLHTAAELALLLWPGHTRLELERELGPLLRSSEAVIMLACDGERAIGYAQCQLRHDYVEGTESSPVAYLEGIYVCEDWRGRGAARELLAACEDWGRQRGCLEMGSDCELDNAASFRFHMATGFAEVNRIICFHKRL